jgi:hypothetical protein
MKFAPGFLAVLMPSVCVSASGATRAAEAPTAAIEALRAYLSAMPNNRLPLGEQLFASTPLTKEQANQARQLLVDDWRSRLCEERQAELEASVISLDDREMPFVAKTFGEKPAGGRSLFISMHGGGNAPARVNDQQWRNQQRLYQPEEGVYVAPRAPTNTWNLWHEPHIDQLFDRLIEDMIVLENVNPNRVYLMGYSAGGDGVYQLAPRMADRFAAAAMMAGHPNETVPLGLRNIGFALHVGERDGGYDRNKVAADWKVRLAELHAADPEGYRHVVEIHPGKGHWMDREDASALAWMSGFTRDPFPRRIVWKQDDVTHHRFYWLAVDADQAKAGAEVRAEVVGQTVQLEAPEISEITVRFNDKMLDLDQEVTIRSGQRELFRGTITRTIGAIATSLAERGDPTSIYVHEHRVKLAP